MANHIDLPHKPPSPPIARLLAPFEVFARAESFSGFLLFVCTAIALAWANSPWADAYHHL